MITDDRMEKALRYLAETDEEIAEAEGELLRSTKLCEMVRDRIFLGATGSVEARKATAGCSAEVAKLEEEVVTATVRFRHLRAKRDTEKNVIEVWRTYQANRRLGA